MNESNAVRAPRHEAAAMVFAVLLPTLVTLLYFVILKPLDERVQQAAYATGKALQFLFPLIWVLLVCREPIRFRPPHPWGMAAGLVFGAVVLAAMLGLYYAWLKPAGFFGEPAKAVLKVVEEMGLASTKRYAATSLFYALIHSFLEEYYWRWFVFGRLEKRMQLGLAVGISSLGFMAHHVILLAVYFHWNSPATYIFSLAIAIGGAAWALLYHRTQSLSGTWLSHLLVDAGIFAIGYDLIRDSL